MDQEGRNYDKEEIAGKGTAHIAIFRHIQGFKGRTSVSSGLPTGGTLFQHLQYREVHMQSADSNTSCCIHKTLLQHHAQFGF